MLCDDGDIQKNGNVISAEFITTVHVVPITSVSWKDNRVLIVSLLSLEWNRYILHMLKKKLLTLSCPPVIKKYNTLMVGVDLIDTHLGRLNIALNSRKLYVRIFYKLLNLCMVNSWLLFKRENPNPQWIKRRFVWK